MSNRTTFQNDCGAAAVEMAILTILLFFLVTGIVDLGRALYVNVAIQDAAQEGAMFGAHHPVDEDQIVSRAAAATDYPELDDTNILVSCPGGVGGDTLQVTVSYELDLITPIVGAMFGDSLDLSHDFTGTILPEDDGCLG